MPSTKTAAVDKRDGYEEMVSAFARARTAFDEGNREAAREAFAAVADGVAGTGELATWDDVLATPFGDRRMPHPMNLPVGELAHYLATEDDDGPFDFELDQVEELIRAAIESSGPADWYRDELYALWGEEPERTPEQRIEVLEKQMQSLADDYAKQLWGRSIVWDDSNGWTLDVTPGKVAGAVDA